MRIRAFGAALLGVAAVSAMVFAGCGGSSSDGGAQAGGPDSDGGTQTDGGRASDAAHGGDGARSSDDASTATICSGAKPGPTNTGVPAGVTLTPSGSVTADKKGQIVEGLDITGSITVLANDVVIRNVRVTSGDYYPVRYFDNDNTGLLVEDSEFISTSGDVTAAVSFSNYTARRLNIHGSADGLKADENVLIEDCWIHDLSNGDGEHNDDVQSTGGKGVTIRHSVLQGGSNSAVQTGDEGGDATEDLTIDCSWLSGGGYTLNIRGTAPTAPKNTVVTNNRFGDDYGYGPWTFDDPNPTVTGNVFDDGGAPLPYP